MPKTQIKCTDQYEHSPFKDHKMTQLQVNGPKMKQADTCHCGRFEISCGADANNSTDSIHVWGQSFTATYPLSYNFGTEVRYCFRSFLSQNLLLPFRRLTVFNKYFINCLFLFCILKIIGGSLERYKFYKRVNRVMKKE